MNDLETMKEIFDRAKIEYREGDFDDEPNMGDESVLTFEARGGWDDDSTLVGYGGFVTQLTFNKEGGLIKMGIWE